MQNYAVIDIETRNALNLGETVAWYGEIIGVGVCTGRLLEDSKYYSGEDIEAIIKELSEKQTPLVAYNALFEVTWLNYHFEQYPLNWIADAALYAIALDNSAPSFSLKDTAQKLVWYEDWGKVVEDYCVEFFKCARSQWGKYIPRLPYGMLAEYCRKDCHATYLIYERGLKMLDIKYINDFFMAEVMLTSEAYTIGTLVNRELTDKLLTETTNTFDNSFAEFNNHPELKEHIDNALKNIYEEGIKKRLEKSKTGKIKIAPFDEWKVKNPFNPGSGKQLTEVFKSQKLFYVEGKDGGFAWPEKTKGGAPCLDADHLFMYGTGGQILAKAGEVKSKKNKLKMIMRDSVHESRAHFDINLCSVRSTRVSSNGLNIVATPLDNEIGDCFTADEGWTFVMPDFTALEPTVSAMLTNDKMLSYCAYFGEGKKPFWENGILNIDDTYLCYLSATKRWRDEIRTMCLDEWMTNPEGLKKRFKIIRQAGKKLVLMTGYGSGIEKVCLSIHKELGIQIDKKEGRELINTLWAVFPDMFRYITWLKAQVAAGRTIHTWLGFPIAPSPEITHCIFNYRVQTEAQHVMKHLLWQIHQRKEKWFVPAIVNIHDATCFQVHDDRVEDFKMILNDALADVNESLAEWTNGIKFRLSVHTGKTLREAKEG